MSDKDSLIQDYVLRRIVRDFELTERGLSDALAMNERLLLFSDRKATQRHFLERLIRFGMN